MINYFVYAIQNKENKRIYVGMSRHPDKRIKEHNSGKVFSTKGFRPWVLIFLENCGTERKNARIRERYWKSGIGKEKLKKIPV